MPQMTGNSQAFNSLPILNALVPSEGPKVLPITCPFLSDALQAFDIDLTQTIQSGRIQVIQSVYIDNRDNASPFTLTCKTTGQVIEVRPHAQGYYPILAGTLPRFAVETIGNVDIPIFFINVPVPASSWECGYLQSIVSQGGVSDTATPWQTRLYLDSTTPISETDPLPITSVPASIETFDAIIAAGNSLSGVITNAGPLALNGIMPPAAWTAANLLVLGSLDGATFAPLRDILGTPLSFPFDAVHALTIPPGVCAQWPFLRVQSVDTSDHTIPVIQVAGCTLSGFLTPTV